MSGPAPGPNPVALFFGWLMIVVGGLIALLCGGCTLLFWVGAIADGVQSPDAAGGALTLALMALVIGGVPAACGGLLIWGGVVVVRPRRPPRPVAKEFE